MKKLVLSALSIAMIITLAYVLFPDQNHARNEDKKKPLVERKAYNPSQKDKKKTPEERALFDEARVHYEYVRQVNPNTGSIPYEDKQAEIEQSKEIAQQASSNRGVNLSYVSRGPSNLGGRARGLVVDISDATGNTILAGGVSGGLFRTTDKGANWTRVSSLDQMPSITALAQDPRPGFQNVWYYGTGEALGSAGLNGSPYLGQGVWQSTDSGLTWTQIAGTSSTQEAFDSVFDFVTNLVVSPANGDLFVAGIGSISRFDGTTWSTEITEIGLNSLEITDVVATNSGRIYAAFSGNSSLANAGVWTSATGDAGWSRIALSGTPTGWAATGRIVLGLAPSNQDILYALYDNGNSNSDASPAIEADLWQWNQATTTWTDYSGKMPDEPDSAYNPTTGAGASAGNDPFSHQGGYDLVVSVKPDDQNFVVIGGTNAYKIEDITTDAMFSRIGGYASPDGYALYSVGDTHHPDIHALEFNPFNTAEMYSGSDGGIHITSNINAASVSWTNLNNNFQTYQYYHVGIDPQTGSDGVIGGSQDNGTSIGGTVFGLTGMTEMNFYFGGDGVASEISRDNACTPLFFGFQNGGMYRDCPGGFQFIAPTGSASEFVTYFHLDPDNNNALYYAGRNTLYRTTDATNVTATVLPTAGALWANMGTSGSIGGGIADWFQRFATTRGAYTTSSYLLMGGDEGGIFRLDNPQNATNISSAIDITPPTASTSYPTICTGLAIHPTNPDIVMISYSNYGVNSIYLTTNATAGSPTWTLVEQNLATFSIRSAAIVEANGKTLYLVGTARGLYANTDPVNNNWTIEAPNQIGFAVISSLRYRPSDNQLLIGTHGNGMFMATVNETLSVESFDGKGNLRLYPNPASSVINFNFENTIGNANYTIYDLTGRSVKRGDLSNSESDINVEGLNSGVYLVELVSGNMKSTGKFIKE